MQAKVKIMNVKWDIDGHIDDYNLPKKIVEIFEYDDEDELEDIISDWLSDEYRLCHKGFDYTTEFSEEHGLNSDD